MSKIIKLTIEVPDGYTETWGIDLAEEAIQAGLAALNGDQLGNFDDDDYNATIDADSWEA